MEFQLPQDWPWIVFWLVLAIIICFAIAISQGLGQERERRGYNPKPPGLKAPKRPPRRPPPPPYDKFGRKVE